jgi:hypothetical protein
MPRQVGKPARVMTVYMAAFAAAGGATGGLRLRLGHEHDLVGLGQDLDNRKCRRDQRTEVVEHGQIIGRIAIPTL